MICKYCGEDKGTEFSSKFKCNDCWKAGKYAWYNKNYKRKPVDSSKVKAHRLVTKAIKEGRLEPQDCEGCSISRKQVKRIYAHHYDYSKPLEVVWLCGVCHYDIHHGHLVLNPT